MTTYKALEDAARKATPGEWRYDAVENIITAGLAGGGIHILDVQPRSIHTGREARNANGDYIALANPTAILSVLEELSTLKARLAVVTEALKRADVFITNSIDLGFIQMPDEGSDDPALETPSIVRAALEGIPIKERRQPSGGWRENRVTGEIWSLEAGGWVPDRRKTLSETPTITRPQG